MAVNADYSRGSYKLFSMTPRLDFYKFSDLYTELRNRVDF